MIMRKTRGYMFYNDSPLSTLINVGMWGFSFFAGHQHGRHSVIKEIESKRREDEIIALRREVQELKRKMSPPPIPPRG
jgi:hypothetical protein